MCDYGEELQEGETPLMLSLNFKGPLCAPMRVAEQESWWVDYWKDHEMRAKYFIVTARQLKNPTQWHQGRIWVFGKDTCTEEARDRGNIPLPRFACRGTLGDKSDYEHGEAALCV